MRQIVIIHNCQLICKICFGGKMEQKSIISKIQYCTANIAWKPHFHNGYEVIFVTSGEIEVIVNNKTYRASRGTIILISNHEHHAIKVISEPYNRYYIIIYPQIADKLINNPLLISILKNRPASFIHCMDISKHMELVTGLFQKLMKENTTKNQLSDDLIACYLKELLILILRDNETAFPNMQKTIKMEIYEIQKYIDTHFAENIQIASLADQYYINLFYLSHSFKKLTGYSPKQYLLLTRMSYARELLITTDTSIKVITDQCGFNDVNNFIRVFKREYQMTPKQYRVAMST